jgi:hypothetical protein
MRYKDPSKILSTKDAVDRLNVIYDGGENSLSIAKINWCGKAVIGMRWNVGMREWNDYLKQKGKECVGVPSSRGHSTWFIIPDEFLEKKSEIWKAIDETINYYANSE